MDFFIVPTSIGTGGPTKLGLCSLLLAASLLHSSPESKVSAFPFELSNTRFDIPVPENGVDGMSDSGIVGLPKRSGSSDPISIPGSLTRSNLPRMSRLNLQAMADNNLGTGPVMFGIPPRESSTSEEQFGPDNGDATDDDIFQQWDDEAGPLPSSSPEPNSWTYSGPEKAQKALVFLDDSAWEGLWDAAEQAGTALREALGTNCLSTHS